MTIAKTQHKAIPFTQIIPRHFYRTTLPSQCQSPDETPTTEATPDLFRFTHLTSLKLKALRMYDLNNAAACESCLELLGLSILPSLILLGIVDATVLQGATFLQQACATRPFSFWAP